MPSSSLPNFSLPPFPQPFKPNSGNDIEKIEFDTNKSSSSSSASFVKALQGGVTRIAGPKRSIGGSDHGGEVIGFVD